MYRRIRRVDHLQSMHNRFLAPVKTMMSMEPDIERIRNIMTLRYDPRAPSDDLPQIQPRDVSEGASDVRRNVEEKIKTNISDFISKNRPRRVSLALSGGTDSILSLILTREEFPELKIQCVSFGFSRDDTDVTIASEMARRYDADFEAGFLDNWLATLPEQISIVGEPKTNYYWHTVAKKARKYSDILITGDGGDELFAGYTFRYKKYQKLVQEGDGWEHRAKLYLACHNRDWVDDQGEMFGPAVNFSWKPIYGMLRRFFDNRLDPLQQVLLADYHGKLLCDWLPSNGRIYSCLGLKPLTPFLSEDLVRYAFTVPSRQKYDSTSNVGKVVLREILVSHGCYLEPYKKGFTPDYDVFWTVHGRNFVTSMLSEKSQVVDSGLISGRWISRALSKVDADGDIRYMTRLLHAASLEVWYRLFISCDMDPSHTF